MRAALTVAMFLFALEPAWAGEIPCAPVESGVILLDGLLGDWRGTNPVRYSSPSHVGEGRKHWSGPRDLSFDVYCNADQRSLYIAVRVVDEYFVRSAAARGDDHLRLRFGSRTLLLYPGDLRSIRRRLRWQGRGKPPRVHVAEAMQVDGYSVELQLPLAQVPGLRRGAPSSPFSVTVADSDSKARQRVETLMSTGAHSRLAFAQQQADLTAFLRDKGYRLVQVRQRRTADVVGDGRLEQVVLVGRTLGIVGDGLPGGGYFYLDLPIRQAQDVRGLRLVDLDGDRKAEIAVRYLERARSGRREILAIFRFDSSNKFVRPFAHEVLKAQGRNELHNRVVFKPRKARRGKPKGTDIVIEHPTARGFSQESYREAPATDAYPILLPWEEVQRRVFRFEGDEFFQL